jgi:hypothetical protein
VSTVSRFRKFLPQVAYVLLAGWTLIADRLDGGHGIDGVTVLAVLVAIAQALAVVIPRSPDVKAGASLITAIAQGVTAAWSDHVITPAEYAVLVSAFLARPSSTTRRTATLTTWPLTDPSTWSEPCTSGSPSTRRSSTTSRCRSSPP